MWNEFGSRSWYDTAEICLNGHVSNSSIKTYPNDCKAFCDECGEKTITSCSHCNQNIRGDEQDTNVYEMYSMPSYCIHCGQPFPWISSRIELAYELADLVDEFTELDKEIITKSIPDLVRDTPRQHIAILQLKKVMKKTTPNIVSGFKDILFDILTEPINKSLWG